MRTITLPLPRFGFVVATRAALGAGLALLFTDQLSPRQRRTAGLALVAVGAVTTIPAVRWLSRSLRRSTSSAAVGSDPRLIGVTRYARKGDDLL